jgi:hypothetical protein
MATGWSVRFLPDFFPIPPRFLPGRTEWAALPLARGARPSAAFNYRQSPWLRATRMDSRRRVGHSGRVEHKTESKRSECVGIRPLRKDCDERIGFKGLLIVFERDPRRLGRPSVAISHSVPRTCHGSGTRGSEQTGTLLLVFAVWHGVFRIAAGRRLAFFALTRRSKPPAPTGKPLVNEPFRLSDGPNASSSCHRRATRDSRTPAIRPGHQ